jgi:hypothetical protein
MILHEVLNPMALGLIGLTFILLGAVLWAFPRLVRKELAFRNDYAAKLNTDGHGERAKKINTETRIIIRRIPIYGKVLVGVGVSLTIGVLLTKK